MLLLIFFAHLLHFLFDILCIFTYKKFSYFLQITSDFCTTYIIIIQKKYSSIKILIQFTYFLLHLPYINMLRHELMFYVMQQPVKSCNLSPTHLNNFYIYSTEIFNFLLFYTYICYNIKKCKISKFNYLYIILNIYVITINI